MNDIPSYAVFDIEASGWIHFEMLGYYNGSEYVCFKKPFHTAIRRFLDYLNKPANKGLWIYAHNGGGYDFKFLLEELLDRGWIEPDGITDRSGRLIRIGVNTGKVRFQFVDSYAALPSSLKKLGDTFDVEHKKTAIDYEEIESNDLKVQEYLENDCLCLYEVLQAYYSMKHIYKRKMTIASQAMDTFQTGFCPGEQLRMTLEDDDYIRKNFYSGGRVEVYKGFGENLNYYDVNSLYPFAMLQKMPLGVGCRTKSYLKGEVGFYEVEIKNTPAWYVSPLLVKGKKNTFLNGAGTYYVSSNMLEQLREEGVRWKVLSGLKFKGSEYLFVKYIRYFYDLKRNAKTESEKMLAKLMLVTLYGKFGQAQWRNKVAFLDSSSEYNAILDAEYGLCYVVAENRNKYIMPYLAAWITDYARLHHYRLMSEHPHSMYYCDTDSLITTARYPTGKGIGELKLEGRYKEGVFLAPKTYALQEKDFAEKVVFKGFAAENFSYAQLKKALVKKQSLTEARTRILGWKEAVRRKKKCLDRTGRFLVLVNTIKTAKYEQANRLHFDSEKYIFDSSPHQNKAVQLTSSLRTD